MTGASRQYTSGAESGMKRAGTLSVLLPNASDRKASLGIYCALAFDHGAN